eukprot:scaffold10067_cov67-Phaeocystis_antarctica.AAC.7
MVLMTLYMSTSPSRWSDSTKERRPSPCLVTLRRCTKCTRSAYLTVGSGADFTFERGLRSSAEARPAAEAHEARPRLHATAAAHWVCARAAGLALRATSRDHKAPRRAVASHAKGQSVVPAVDGTEHMLDVILGGDDAWQPEQRQRRVVRVDRQHDARLLGDGHHLDEEVAQVGAQPRMVDVLVGVEGELELGERVGLDHAARHPRDHRLCECLDARRRHARKPRRSERSLSRPEVRLCARPLQDVDLEGDEVGVVEGERFGAVVPHAVELGARPVDDRHEVVGELPDATGAQVADGLLVVGDVAVAAVRTLLDCLVHRHTLHH